MEEKVKGNGLLKIIVLLIILLVVIIVGFAFARYVTSLKGHTEAKIANWSVEIKVDKYTEQDFVVNLADTRIRDKEEAEVQEGFIAPGTAGMFDIVINATDSEVSLEYDVNIDVDNEDNKKLPKNLIFYSDEEMENAIYHENNVINFNGFIRHDYADIEKTKTIHVYWKWAYETGTTKEEKNANDIADSYWMGKPPISIGIKVVAKQVVSDPITQYAVTFDANGGTLNGYGNATQTTKQVTYGDVYGELPIPTKAGYKFDGWITEHETIDNKVFGPASTKNTTFAGHGIKVYPGVTYVVTADSIYLTEGNQTQYSTLVYDYTENATKSSRTTNFGNNIEYTIKVSESLNPEHDLNLLFYIGNVNNTLGNKIEVTNFMSIGRYTESTKMLRNQNHTLIAKWIKE